MPTSYEKPDEEEWSDDLHTQSLKERTYQQQDMLNNLHRMKGSEKAVGVLQPQFEQSLGLYGKALKKYKKK